MKQQNPLFFLFKRLSWPYGLIIAAVIITSLGSLSGLLVPLFTGRIVDKFSVSSINWGMIGIFGAIFLVNALLSGVGLYLLSKIGEKNYLCHSFYIMGTYHPIKMPFFDKTKVVS